MKRATQAPDQQASTANACAGSSAGVSKTCQSWMLGLRTEQISACMPRRSVCAARALLLSSTRSTICEIEPDWQNAFLLTQRSRHLCVIVADVRTCSFIARMLTVIIQEDELCSTPALFYAVGRCQPYANQRASVPDWRKPNNSRVTLTTTRLCPACHLASAQSCIKQSDEGALCMDALAFRTSSSLFDPPSTHVNRFH